MSGTILEHPFWDDYFRLFQANCLKKLGQEGQMRLKKIHCELLPVSLLAKHWEGWEIGIPRPLELIGGDDTLTAWQPDIELFLKDFFRRVEGRILYCDYSHVIDKFGEDVEARTNKRHGLEYNLESVYWTFNVKFNQWIDHNIRLYNCSLVCCLDEILARFDGYIRAAFFSTPGPYSKNDPRGERKLQELLLRRFAPHLEENLIAEIWQ